MYTVIIDNVVPLAGLLWCSCFFPKAVLKKKKKN